MATTSMLIILPDSSWKKSYEFSKIKSGIENYLGRAWFIRTSFGPWVSFGRRNSRLPKGLRRPAHQRARCTLPHASCPATSRDHARFAPASSRMITRVAPHLLARHARTPAYMLLDHPRLAHALRAARPRPRDCPAWPVACSRACAALWPHLGPIIRAAPALLPRTSPAFARCSCMEGSAGAAAWYG